MSEVVLDHLRAGQMKACTSLLNTMTVATRGGVSNATMVQLELLKDQCLEVASLFSRNAANPRTVGMMVESVSHLEYLYGREMMGTVGERLMAMTILESVRGVVADIACSLGVSVKERSTCEA